jgi:hypothetical protein
VFPNCVNVFNLCDNAGIAEALIEELDLRFPTHHVMDAMGVVFPQYSMQENVERTFSTHLCILKDVLCHSKCVVELDGEGDWVKPLLSAKALDEESCMFKMSMLSQSKLVMMPPYYMNPATKL